MPITLNGSTGITTPGLTNDGSQTITNGTANGVAYLNGSKVLTTGSALTFDGTNFATTGSVTSAGASNSGNLTFTGTGNRITGDFSNATNTSRVFFQTTTANSATNVGIIPNGSNQISLLQCWNNSDPTNASVLDLRTDSSDVRIRSGIAGTGTYLPMTFHTGGSERMRLDTSGNLGIGTSSPASSFGRSLHLYNDANTGTVASNAYLLVESSTRNAVIEVSGSASSTNSVNFSDTPGTTLAGIASNVVDQNLLFRTGGTSERMRLDSSGNLGIGTSSPGNNRLAVVTTSGTWEVALIKNNQSASGAFVSFQAAAGGSSDVGAAPDAANTLVFRTASSERARIDSSGNFGIGTSSPASKLDVRTAGNGGISGPSTGTWTARVVHNNDAAGGNGLSVQNRWASTGSTIFQCAMGWNGGTNGYYPVFTVDGLGQAIFSPQAVEAMRIDSSGNLLVGTTSADAKLVVLQSANSTGEFIRASNASFTSNVLDIQADRNTTNSTYNFIAAAVSGVAYRFYVRDSGNVVNTNNSYGAISDAKLKENVTDATPKLEKLQQVRVVNYNLIGETQKQLGVVAQELEQIFPGMVEESPDRDAEGNDLGTTTKSVKYSVFVPMLIKAIQELNAKLDAQAAEIAALKGTA